MFSITFKAWLELEGTIATFAGILVRWMCCRDTLSRSTNTWWADLFWFVLTSDSSVAGRACTKKRANKVQATGIVLAWVRETFIDFDLALGATEADGTDTVVATARQGWCLKVVALSFVAWVRKAAT